MGLIDTSRTILVVDDEEQLTEVARDEFEAVGWNVFVEHSAGAAKEVLARHQFSAILSDFAMPGESGIDLLQWVRATLGDRMVFFLLTGGVDLRARDAMKFGANAVFHKPCDWPRLINAVTVAVTLQSARN
jgi:two-component system OmpR family response regulator